MVPSQTQTGVAASEAGRGSVSPEYARVLVFMDVSSQDLVAASAAAQESIASALQRLCRERVVQRRIFVRVLVHGYQNQGSAELDSKLICYDRIGDPCTAGSTLQWSYPTDDQRLPYFPGDPRALRRFVADNLGVRDPAADPFRAVLFIWGHGEGVGNRLGRAHGVGKGQRLPASVDRPALLNTLRNADLSPFKSLQEPLNCALGDKGRLDLLVLDSCLMAAAEVAFECRDIARFLIASQSFVQRPGLNLGRSITEYLRALEGLPSVGLLSAAEPAEPAEGVPRFDSGLEGGKRIVGLTGALQTGADQLTLFRLDPAEEFDPCERRGLPPRPRCVTLADWMALLGEAVRGKTVQPASPPPIAQPIVEGLNAAGWDAYPWSRLLWAFSQLLRWACSDADEYPRVLAAFRATFYVKTRQFLDLKDLARQVHQYSRLRPLQVVALELMRELEEGDTGFVVRWRAVLEPEEKRRYGGVSIYCPWFEAEGPLEYDAIVDHEAYRALDLPRLTEWGGFVLGPMYAQLAGRRERAEREARDEFEEDLRWLRILQRILADGIVPTGATAADAVAALEKNLGGPVKGSGPQADLG